MKIPSRFKIFGHTIEVKHDPQLVNRHDSTGEAHYRFNEIIIQPIEGYSGRPQSRIEQDFLHELVHFVLYYGECEMTKGLYKNEQVVDRLACILHQAITSSEYEETP